MAITLEPRPAVRDTRGWTIHGQDTLPKLFRQVVRDRDLAVASYRLAIQADPHYPLIKGVTIGTILHVQPHAWPLHVKTQLKAKASAAGHVG